MPMPIPSAAMISDAYSTSPAVVQTREASKVDTFSRSVIEMPRFPCRALSSQYQYWARNDWFRWYRCSSTAMLLAGIDPALAGRDQLPSVPEHFEVINRRETNWCVVPWALPEWAAVVHPELEPDAALAALFDDLAYVLRLDEADAAAAWRSRFAELHDVGTKL